MLQITPRSVMFIERHLEKFSSVLSPEAKQVLYAACLHLQGEREPQYTTDRALILARRVEREGRR